MEPKDRVGEFFRERTPRRLLALAIFVGALVLFRHLLVLLVFFVAFERLFGIVADFLGARLRIGRKPALLVLVLGWLGGLGVAAAVGIGRVVRTALEVRHTLPEKIAAIREAPLFHQVQEHLGDADHLVDGAQHYAAGALGYLATFGHMVVYATVGFILAVVYVLEREELEAFAHRIDPRSLPGTLLRWFGDVADATVVTLQFQLVVAACNAVLTLPILVLVGIPHKATLLVLIFVSGLVPVVGNFIIGGVLMFLAYQARGWLGLAVFTGLTFVLHKLEAYYLNPRLAARHVRLPGFVLIVSLVLWEHLLGFVGLFVSFPFLFVADRILSEFRAADEADGAARKTSGVV
jgi:predicted PurR-regulated permease PerM